MSRAKRICTLLGLYAHFLSAISNGQEAAPLAGTGPFTVQGDISAQMVEGIDRFLMREIERAEGERVSLWARNFSSREAYEKSVAPNRERFRRMVGVVDSRLAIPALEFIGSTAEPSLVAETDQYTVHAVRWPVFDQVFGEGLLLQPKGRPAARVVVVPDSDQTPEMFVGLASGLMPDAQIARRLAEHGCQVLVPVLIDRKD